MMMMITDEMLRVKALGYLKEKNIEVTAEKLERAMSFYRDIPNLRKQVTGMGVRYENGEWFEIECEPCVIIVERAGYSDATWERMQAEKAEKQRLENEKVKKFLGLK